MKKGKKISRVTLASHGLANIDQTPIFSIALLFYNNGTVKGNQNMTIKLDKATQKEILDYVEPALKGADYVIHGIERSNMQRAKKNDLLAVVKSHHLALLQLKQALLFSTMSNQSGIPMFDLEVKD